MHLCRFGKNNPTMRITHIIWGLKAGGAELMLVDIVNEQVKSHDVSIFVVNNEVYATVKKCLNTKVRLYCIGRPPGSKNPWYFFILNLYLIKYQPNIIHCHQDGLVSLVRLLKFHKVLTLHDTKIILTSKINQFNAVYCISRSVQYDIGLRYPQLKTRIVYNGIKTGIQIIKSAFNYAPFRIVQVSNLIHEKKGQDLLIRALALLVHQYKIDLTVDFIGEGLSENYLRALAVELGLESYCQFIGPKSRQFIYSHLHNYDLLVQPSRKEGFGLTVIEGMTSGVPVLVSDIEGPMEIIADGDYGFHFKNGDYENLCAQILNIIKLSREQDFMAYCVRAKLYVDHKFDIANTAQAYIDEYTHVIAAVD